MSNIQQHFAPQNQNHRLLSQQQQQQLATSQPGQLPMADSTTLNIQPTPQTMNSTSLTQPPFTIITDQQQQQQQQQPPSDNASDPTQQTQSLQHQEQQQQQQQQHQEQQQQQPSSPTQPQPQPISQQLTASGINPGLLRSPMVDKVVGFLQSAFSNTNKNSISKNIDLVKLLLFLEEKDCFSAEIAEGFARTVPEHFISRLLIRASQKGFVLSQYVYCYLLILAKRDPNLMQRDPHLNDPASNTTTTAAGDQSQSIGMNISITQSELDQLEAELNHLHSHTDVVYITETARQTEKKSTILRSTILSILGTLALITTTRFFMGGSTAGQQGRGGLDGSGTIGNDLRKEGGGVQKFGNGPLQPPSIIYQPPTKTIDHTLQLNGIVEYLDILKASITELRTEQNTYSNMTKTTIENTNRTVDGINKKIDEKIISNQDNFLIKLDQIDTKCDSQVVFYTTELPLLLGKFQRAVEDLVDGLGGQSGSSGGLGRDLAIVSKQINTMGETLGFNNSIMSGSLSELESTICGNFMKIYNRLEEILKKLKQQQQEQLEMKNLKNPLEKNKNNNDENNTDYDSDNDQDGIKQASYNPYWSGTTPTQQDIKNILRTDQERPNFASSSSAEGGEKNEQNENGQNGEGSGQGDDVAQDNGQITTNTPIHILPPPDPSLSNSIFSAFSLLDQIKSQNTTNEKNKKNLENNDQGQGGIEEEKEEKEEKKNNSKNFDQNDLNNEDENIIIPNSTSNPNTLITTGPLITINDYINGNLNQTITPTNPSSPSPAAPSSTNQSQSPSELFINPSDTTTTTTTTTTAVTLPTITTADVTSEVLSSQSEKQPHPPQQQQHSQPQTQPQTTLTTTLTTTTPSLPLIPTSVVGCCQNCTFIPNYHAQLAVIINQIKPTIPPPTTTGITAAPATEITVQENEQTSLLLTPFQKNENLRILKSIRIYLNNIAKSPTNEQKRRISASNPVIRSISSDPLYKEFITLIGFELTWQWCYMDLSCHCNRDGKGEGNKNNNNNNNLNKNDNSLISPSSSSSSSSTVLISSLPHNCNCSCINRKESKDNSSPPELWTTPSTAGVSSQLTLNEIKIDQNLSQSLCICGSIYKVQYALEQLNLVLAGL